MEINVLELSVDQLRKSYKKFHAVSAWRGTGYHWRPNLELYQLKIFLNIPEKNSDFFSLKQSPEVFCKKRSSEKFCKIHMKTPVPESFFNKVASQRPASLLKNLA